MLNARDEVLDVQDRLACLLVGLLRILGGHYDGPTAALASAFTDPDASGRIEVKLDPFGCVDPEWLQEQALQGAAESQALARHVVTQLEQELSRG